MPSNIVHGSDGSGSVTNIPANIANGVMDSRNPNLLPNVDPTLASAVGVPNDLTSRLQNESVPDYAVDSHNSPATEASGSVAIGGTETDGDMISITLAGHTVTHTTSGGESTSSIATALAGLINANMYLGANFHAVAAGPDVNISALASGSWFNSFGNASMLMASVSLGATETVTVTAMSGGAGLLWPQSDFQFIYQERMFYFLKGRPFTSNDAVLLALLQATGNFGPNT